MNAIECIETRRSQRFYTDEPIAEQTILRLIELGTKAANGSALEPWGFVVIQDAEEIDAWSEKIKAHLLANLETFPQLSQYEGWLRKPNFSVFNHAHTLIAIYGDTKSHWHVYDCSLVAGNIMLAAHDMGIGTCWIGFGEYMLNTPEFKQKYNVPSEFSLVCPMTLGYHKRKLNPPKRKAPVIFNRA